MINSPALCVLRQQSFLALRLLRVWQWLLNIFYSLIVPAHTPSFFAWWTMTRHSSLVTCFVQKSQRDSSRKLQWGREYIHICFNMFLLFQRPILTMAQIILVHFFVHPLKDKPFFILFFCLWLTGVGLQPGKSVTNLLKHQSCRTSL